MQVTHGHPQTVIQYWRVIDIQLTYHFPTSLWRERMLNKNNKKQLSKGVPGKRCSENMQQIYRRTTMWKCDFNKVAKRLFHITTLGGCCWTMLLQRFWIYNQKLFWSFANKENIFQCWCKHKVSWTSLYILNNITTYI